MIVEHEILEQIETEAAGRSLRWCADLARRHGCDEAMTTLRQMWRAGYIAIADGSGSPLADWQVEEMWRAGSARDDVAVLATDRGLDWVYG